MDHEWFSCFASRAAVLFTLLFVAMGTSRQAGAWTPSEGVATLRADQPTDGQLTRGRRPSPILATGSDSPLALVERNAEAHNQRGFDLASRGALYSAQAEFVRALKLIGRTRDEMNQSRRCSEAIVAGLTALEEVDDFGEAPTSTARARDLAETIATHRTVALKNRDASSITAVGAARAYCAFAQEQLLAGCGQVRAASTALYGLGRIEIAVAREPNGRGRLGAPKAMAMFEAALRIDPNHHQAANELGALLTRYGQDDVAVRFLQQSVCSVPTSEAWQNLAVAYSNLGNDKLAQHAVEQSKAIRQKGAGSQPSISPAGLRIRWVDQASFVKNSPPDFTPTKPNTSPVIRKQDAPSEAQATRLGAAASGKQKKSSMSGRASTVLGFDKFKSGLKSILR
jgi:tetratricopeptide (TPR) repeat protein